MDLVAIALFPLLDEVGVLDHARGIEIDADAVAVAQLAQGLARWPCSPAGRRPC